MTVTMKVKSQQSKICSEKFLSYARCRFNEDAVKFIRKISSKSEMFISSTTSKNASTNETINPHCITLYLYGVHKTIISLFFSCSIITGFPEITATAYPYNIAGSFGIQVSRYLLTDWHLCSAKPYPFYNEATYNLYNNQLRKIHCQ